MPPRRAAAIAAAIVATALVAHADDAPAPPRGRIQIVEHTPLGDAPTRGRHDAPVTVEVYFSAGSELGNQAYARAMRLWRRHPGRVRLVFYPIRRSDDSEYVAPIALAAHVHGRFFEFMDQIVGRTGPRPLPDDVIELAVKAGLDREAALAAKACDPCEIKDVLDENNRRSVRVRVSQRADLVINGRQLGPTPDENTLEAAYQSALQRARIELAAGALATAVPALSARLARCAEQREHVRSRRGRRAPAPDVEDRNAPVAGWHLGALLADGTGCIAESPPTGRVDQAYDFETSRRTDGPATLLTAPLSTAELPTRGPADAPVVIQVICNLRSPSCSDQLLRARKVMIEYWPYVRVVYRPWVDLVLEGAELELPFAEALLCGQRLGNGWTFLMALGRGGDDTRFDLAARRAGVDPEAFAACAEASTRAARRVIDEARAAGVGYVPTVVVGQRAYVGGLTDDRPLKDLVDAELAPGLLGATADASGDPALEDWARSVPPYTETD